MSKRELARRPDQSAMSPGIEKTSEAGSNDPNNKSLNSNEEMTVSQMVNEIGRKGVQIGLRNRHGMLIFP